MASFNLGAFSTTARTLGTREDGFISQNASLSVSGGPAVTMTGDDPTLTVLGSLNAFEGSSSSGTQAIATDPGTPITDGRLTVGPNGSISSDGTAIDLDVSSFFEIRNSGLISSTGAFGNAINLSNTDGTAQLLVENTGKISANAAIIINGGAVLQQQILNIGEIIGRNDTITSNGSANVNIYNYGYIGNLFGSTFQVIELGSSSTSGNDIVINAGTITGRVWLEAGNDTFDGRGGTLNGRVEGGLGDDTYIIDDSDTALVEFVNQGTDTVQSAADAYALENNFENLTLIGAGNIDGTGNDTQNTITGNAGANVINGLGSRDTINAGGGNDTVDAGRGNDTVEGGDGDDSIVGRAGNDILNGGEGSDFIFGGLGNDVIDGGNGDDRLKGGLGADTLTGGSGADTFLFCRTDESPTAAFDRVTDFDAGLDVLDLSGMTDAPLTFSSAGAIGGGTASVFLSVTGGGNTNVFVDVDGDGTADARVLLQGSTGVTEADFIF